MGTSYHFDGSVRIKPALNFGEVKAVREALRGILHEHHVKRAQKMDDHDVALEWFPINLMISEEKRETPDGVLTVISADEVRPVRSYGGSSYRMDSIMRQMVDAAPGHEWWGDIVEIYEDHTSGQKLVARITSDGGGDIKIVSGTASITWGDGTTYSLISLIC